MELYLGKKGGGKFLVKNDQKLRYLAKIGNLLPDTRLIKIQIPARKMRL